MSNRRKRNRAARRATLRTRAERRRGIHPGEQGWLDHMAAMIAGREPTLSEEGASWLDAVVDEQRAAQAAQGITPELLADAAEADETIDADELERHAAELSVRKTKAARA